MKITSIIAILFCIGVFNILLRCDLWVGIVFLVSIIAIVCRKQTIPVVLMIKTIFHHHNHPKITFQRFKISRKN